MNDQRGFTLLEVLIALAILAISLTALMTATSEDIRNTVYLKDKTVAMMLGNNVLLQVQDGKINAPFSPYNNNFNLLALKQTYYMRVTRFKTNDAYADAIEITTFLDQNTQHSIYTTYGYSKGVVG